MDQMKTQTRLQAFFMVFKQAILTVGSHLYLILLPLGLDLFLLFGPRLSLSSILNPMIIALPAIDNFEQQFSISWDDFLSSTVTIVGQFNLFSSLRTLPFGLPSMMSQRLGVGSPFGEAQQLELANFSTAFLVFILLSLIGIFLGTVYFKLIAKAVIQPASGNTEKGTSLFSSYSNLVVFNILTWVVSLIVLIPVAVVLGLLIHFSAGLGYFAYMFVVVVVLSLAMPLVFTPVYLIIQRSTLIKAAVKSISISRRAGVLTSLFIILSITVYYLTNMLWNSAPDTSPFVLVGVFGHALVTTIIFTASVHFVDWLEKVDIGQKPLIG